jgi:hypothetical protein
MAIIMTEGFRLTFTEIDGLILTEDNVIITAEDNQGAQYDDE